jgi:hypothetical protein
MTPKADQNYINHIVFALDASSSMLYSAAELIRVADSHIAHLAQRSKELGQETRVTIYVFANEAKCVIYDMDVLRLPSVAKYYRANGMTALIDATMLSIEDLAMTPEKYGDHAFLIFVLTDGQENRSRHSPSDLVRTINGLPDHWTLAALVPDQRGKFEAKKFGFSPDNIAIWDATTAHGINEGGGVIREATERFMQGREKGIRGTRHVFSTGADAVNADTIQAAALTPLPRSKYRLVPVTEDTAIRPFVENECQMPYRLGMAYYELSKREIIQPQKELAVLEIATDRVYVGDGVRDLIGLSRDRVTVRPDFNPKYKIHVQSTSVNRKLKEHTKVLLLEA